MNKNKGATNVIIYSIILYAAAISTIYCFIATYRVNCSGYITLIPATWLVCVIVGKRNRENINSISLGIINISALFRYALYPAMYVNSFSGLLYNNGKLAVYIMIYEMIGIYATIAIFGNKMHSDGMQIRKKEQIKHLNEKIGLPSLVVIIATIGSIILFPNVLNRFSIFGNLNNVSSSIPGFIEVVFVIGVWIIFVNILTMIKKLGNGRKGKGTLKVFLSLVVSSLYIFMCAGDNDNVRRWQIVIGTLSTYEVLKYMYPKKILMLRIVVGIGGITALIVGTLVKFGSEWGLIVFINQFITAEYIDVYFSGIGNIIKGLNLVNGSIHLGLNNLMTDLFSGMPIVSVLFDAKSNSLPALYNMFISRSDQVCPLVIQSYAYFGFAGVPILSCLFVYVSIKFNQILNSTNYLYTKFVVTGLCVYFALVMELNTVVIMGSLWTRLICLLIFYLDSKFKFRIYSRKEVYSIKQERVI